MPIDLLEEKASYGKIRYEWDFPEFTPYERGLVWYVIYAVAVFGILVYSWFSQNLLFAIFIILAAFIVWFIQQRQPRMLNIKITELGIVIENLFYTFAECKYYWIVAESSDDAMIFLEFTAPTIPRLGVPFIDIDPDRLDRYLGERIEKHPSREGMPISETISRFLRL